MENNKVNKLGSSNWDYKNEVKIRNNIKSILYKFVSKIISNIAIIIPIIIFLKSWSFIAISLMLIFDLIYIFLLWINEYVLLLDNEARYHYGIFSKNTMIIPKNNIKSMDISISISERILRYSSVKIESPVKGADLDQIKLYLSNKDIDKLKSFAFNSNCNEECINKENITLNKDIKKDVNRLENIYVKKVKIKELFKYGITSFNIIIIIVVGMKGYSVLENIIKDSTIIDVISNSTVYLTERFNFVMSLVGIIVLIILLKIIAIIYYIIKYYDFTILKDGDNIKVKYGLINSREFSFNCNNVKNVKLKANIFRQFIKSYEMTVSVKGYNDSGDEKIIIYPIGKEEELFNILKEILPKFVIEGSGEGIKKGKFMLVLKPSIIVIILSFIAYLIFKNSYVFLLDLILVYIIPNSILKGNNLNLKIEKDKIKVVKGGIFKIKYLLDKKDIQAVKFTTTPFLKKYNLGKISICCYSEIGEEVTLNYMNRNKIPYIIKKKMYEEKYNYDVINYNKL